ncbi:hypothetical protein DRN74_00110 [Candidatus Micrarchaeota archaeon]|nr:MAG: hypothetical protein DRN74_00110 [Candidatus Micrarchaeota archaeon]
MERAYAFLMALVLISSVFTPYAYAIRERNNNDYVVHDISVKEKSLSHFIGSSDDNCWLKVRTSAIDHDEFSKLMEAVDEDIDSFGNIVLGRIQRERERAGIADDPEVEKARNQIFMINGVPVRLYDIASRSAKNPDDVCHLSSVLVDGAISLGMGINQNLRFCADNPSPACEEGYASSVSRKDLVAVERIISELKKAEDDKEVNWDAVSSEFEKLHIDFETDGKSDGELLDEATANLASIIKEKKVKYSPANIIESNRTFITLAPSDIIYLFPKEIMNMANVISGLRKDLNKWNLMGLGVGLSSIGIGWMNSIATRSVTRLGRGIAEDSDEFASLTRQGGRVRGLFTRGSPSQRMIRRWSRGGGTITEELVPSAGQGIRDRLGGWWWKKVRAKNLRNVGIAEDEINGIADALRKGNIDEAVKKLDDITRDLDNIPTKEKVDDIADGLRRISKQKQITGEALNDQVSKLDELAEKFPDEVPDEAEVKKTLGDVKKMLEGGSVDKEVIEKAVKKLDDLAENLPSNTKLKAFKEELEKINYYRDINRRRAIADALERKLTEITPKDPSNTKEWSKAFQSHYKDKIYIGQQKIEDVLNGWKREGRIMDSDISEFLETIESGKYDEAIKALPSDIQSEDIIADIRNVAAKAKKTTGGKIDDMDKFLKAKVGGEYVGELGDVMTDIVKANAGGFGALIDLARAAGKSKALYYLASAAIRVGQRARYVLDIGRTAMFAGFIASTAFKGDVQGFFSMHTFNLELSPKEVLKQSGKDGYVDVLAVSRKASIDMVEPDMVTAVLAYFGIDVGKMLNAPPSEEKIIAEKLKSISKMLFFMDQEGSVVEGRINSIGRIDELGSRRFMLLARNPAQSHFLLAEHPHSYKVSSSGKYSSLLLNINNVDLSVIGPDVVDYAQPDRITTFLANWMPSPWKLVLMGAAWGIFDVAAVATSKLGILGVSIPVMYYATRLFGERGTSLVSDITKTEAYVKLVDIEEAMKSENNCVKVRKREADKLGKIVKGAEALIALGAGVDVVDTFAPGPWQAATLLAQLGIAYAQYKQEKKFAEAQVDALNAMKGCYDTKFLALGIQKIPTKQKTEKDVMSSLKSGELEGVVSGLDQTVANLIKSLTPSESVSGLAREFADNYYWNVMSLQGDYDGPSITRITGDEIYRVHFNRDATMKWFNTPDCAIDYCQELDNGQYWCMRSEGYKWLDNDGNTMVEGPQAASARWRNNDGYMEIAVKSIDINNKVAKAMTIHNDITPYVSFDDPCLKKEVAKLMGLFRDGDYRAYADTLLKNSLGDLELIKTEDAYIWMEDGDVIVSFNKQKVCGDRMAASKSIARFEGADIEIYGDGTVKIVKDGEELPCGNFKLGKGLNAGYVSFENGKLMAGDASAYKKLFGWKDLESVLHLIIYDLSSVNGDVLDNMGWERCSVEIDGKTYYGFRLSFDFDGESNKEEQWNTLLDDRCFIDWTAVDDYGGIRFNTDEDGNAYAEITLPSGEQVRVDDLEYNEEKKSFEGKGEDGHDYSITVKVENGQPTAYVMDEEGNVYRMPLWMARSNNGALVYDGKTGALSITNTFPFAINPDFINYGADGNAMMSPGRPPWIVSEQDISRAEQGWRQMGQQNILAALPWTPTETTQLLLFVVLLLSGLLLIRRRRNEN